MSLINDALKKAQRQRTGDSPQSAPPMPGGSVASTRPARSGSGGNPQLVLVGAGALLGLVIAGAAVFLFRSKPAPTEPTATVASVPRPAEIAATKPSEPSVAKPAAVVPPASASAQSSEPVVLVAKTEPPAPAPEKPVAVSSAPEVVEKNAPASVAATPPPAPSTPPTPSLRMIEAIEALRVAGIRVGSGSDAKVLMNDRVYRLGDTVDHALGIKLSGATASSLTFRDAAGATYTRNF